MTTALTKPAGNLPTDPKTGVTLPLSGSLDSQALAKHRAVVGFEFEVLAKKYDRFGWERDADTPEQNRLITDWMDALQDYPLDEVQAACREWVRSNPRKMPNEGDILSKIQKARNEAWQAHKAQMPPEPEKPKERVSADRAAEILAEAGYSPRRFGGDA